MTNQKETKKAEIKLNFLEAYTKHIGSSCAKEITRMLIKGSDLKTLINSATSFNKKIGKNHKWGQTAGSLNSHFNWLKGRNVIVNEIKGKLVATQIIETQTKKAA